MRVKPEPFFRRLERLYDSWKEDDLDFVQWNNVDAISAAVGRDEVYYAKSKALQVWLFGRELTHTVSVFCENEIHILASKKKIDFLKPLEPVIAKRSDLPKLRLHLRSNDDADVESFQKIVKAIKFSKNGLKVGVFTKDSFTGDFVEGWKKALKNGNLEMMDISAVFAYVSAVKEDDEVENIKEQEDSYNFLLTVYEKVLEALKDGACLSSVYVAAMDHIEQNKPELLEHFTTTAGFATGIEFRECSLMIGPKCTATAKAGMVFNVTVGFNQLENSQASDDKSRVYAVIIGDTVVVNKDGAATELTLKSEKKLTNIAIPLGDDDENKGPQINPNDVLHARDRRFTTVLDSRTRTEIPAEDKRKLHQMQLTKQINEEARRRLLETQQQKKQKKTRGVITVYKNVANMPKKADVQNVKLLFIDKRYEIMIIPVDGGVAIPFHVSTVKNISKSEEGDSPYLRINFFFPGSAVGRNDGIVYPNRDETFLEEMSFQSSSESGGMANLANVFLHIKVMQRKFKAHENKEMEGIVEQAGLIMNTSQNYVILEDLLIWPFLGSHRIKGSLEAHTNGLRYTTLKGDKVDILYNNIKHAFFQPSKGEMIVLIHFHLKNPITIGKMKCGDVQMYVEIRKIMKDLGIMHDHDDLLAEQAERELRIKLDNAFSNFCCKLETMPQCHVEFEKPFRELGFYGVPSRSTVQLCPTTNCLINLAEFPPFIVTLDEVELVHFERVACHLKNFDMVFVFKDYDRKVSMVNSIPASSLDPVKKWLNSCDIKYTEGIQSLNWAKTMKSIMVNPAIFVKTGGWAFLERNSDGTTEHHDTAPVFQLTVKPHLDRTPSKATLTAGSCGGMLPSKEEAHHHKPATDNKLDTGDASGKPTLQAQDQFIEDIFDQLLAEMPAINKFLAGR